MAQGHLRYRHEVVFDNNAGTLVIDINAPTETLSERDEAFIRAIGSQALRFQAEQVRKRVLRRRHETWKHQQEVYARPVCWPGVRAAPAATAPRGEGEEGQ